MSEIHGRVGPLRNTSFSNNIWLIRVTRLGWLVWNIFVKNDHGYVLFVVNTSWSFRHSWLITGFVTRLTRRVPLAEQELLPFRRTWVHPRILVGSCYSIFSLMCIICRSLFVLLSVWPLCCLPLLVFSNSSSNHR